MATKRRQVRNEQRGGRDSVSDVNAPRRVEQLRQSFAKFRRTHRPRTRIPGTLREATLAALQRGTTELEVRRACGVTAEQIAQWRHHRGSCAERGDLSGQEAQVFPVVDEMSGMNIDGADGHAEQNLELRVGRWAICIGQVKA